jgi:hypothetical protein
VEPVEVAVAVAVVDDVLMAAVASPAKDLARHSPVGVAFQEVDMHNLEEETCAAGEVDIHLGHRMEEAGIDNCHIREEVEDTGALEDRLEIAVSAVEEQKSAISTS